jgi:peptide/nickel transport system ATP-binding protein
MSAVRRTGGAPLLEVRDLTVRYAGGGATAPALDGVSFTLAEGEAVGVLGESGCGKTTLALAVAGLLPPGGEVVGGSVRFRGRSLLALGEAQLCALRGAEIGCVFQQPALALHPMQRARDQVAEVLRAHRGGRLASWRSQAGDLLAEVGLDGGDLADAYPHQLSGGQRQRVAIAQALACRPALVLADEPTASLDGTARDGILALLRSLARQSRLALLIISHDPRVLASAADRLLRIEAGRLTPHPPIGRTAVRPYHGTRPAESDVGAHGCAPGGEGDAVLRAQGLARVYPPRHRRGAAVTAFEDVDLELRAGSILALVGESGGGKSTLARCLALLEEPTAGEVFVDGEAASAADRRRRAALRRTVQLLFQDPSTAVNPRFAAIDVVIEPLRLRGFGDRPWRRRRARQLMREVGFPEELAGRSSLELSGGELQRLAIARALAAEPRALILDEGLASLDVALQERIAGLLLDLRRRHGLAYLLISHDLRFAARLADEVAVLDRGRIVERAAPDELLRRPRHPASRALVASARLGIDGDAA